MASRKVNGRTKGHDWERNTVQYFLPFDSTARRNLAETQNLDDNQGVDILLDNLPFAVQCKNAQIWKGWDAMREVMRSKPVQKDGKIPVGFIKQSCRKSKEKRECVILTLDGFRILLEAFLQNHEQPKKRVFRRGLP